MLKGLGFTLAALALSPDAVTLDEFAANPPEKIALVVGTEGDGLSTAALAAADTVVTIPMMHGVDSLECGLRERRRALHPACRADAGRPGFPVGSAYP